MWSVDWIWKSHDCYCRTDVSAVLIFRVMQKLNNSYFPAKIKGCQFDFTSEPVIFRNDFFVGAAEPREAVFSIERRENTQPSPCHHLECPTQMESHLQLNSIRETSQTLLRPLLYSLVKL